MLTGKNDLSMNSFTNDINQNNDNLDSTLQLYSYNLDEGVEQEIEAFYLDENED